MGTGYIFYNIVVFAQNKRESTNFLIDKLKEEEEARTRRKESGIGNERIILTWVAYDQIRYRN